MRLGGKLEIKSNDEMLRFLNQEHVGRIATIDGDGYPQIIPMNFAVIRSIIYMHSHVRGEKLDNIRRDWRAGFEVDRELEFLPSYFEDPKDASLADTLYISVVIKGRATLVADRAEKAEALNALMSKYQPEGRYEPIKDDMRVLDAVSIIRIVPEQMRGKYKIGQHLSEEDRINLASKILERGSDTARSTLSAMGFEVRDGAPVRVREPGW